MPFHHDSKSHTPLDFKLLLSPQFKISEHAALYLSHTMRSFALGMVGIFLPIYIYKLSMGFTTFHPDQFIDGVTWVIVYLMLRSLFTVISIFALTHTIFKGLEFGKSILISLFVLMLEIGLWMLAEKNLNFIIIAGALSGLKVALYWIPYHVFFVEKLKKTKIGFGKATALRSFLIRLANAGGPLVGGLIIANFGFNYLFITVILLLILSGLPTLFLVSEWKHKEHYPAEITRMAIFDKKYRKLSVGYMGEGFETLVYGAFWPLAMFIYLEGFVEIGIVNSLSFAASAFLALFVGKLMQRKGASFVHIVGAITNAFLYIPRMLFTTAGWVYAIHIVDRLNTTIYSLPNMSIAYDKASRIGKSDYILFREIVLHFAIVVASAAVFLILPVLPDWRWILLLAMFGSLLTLNFDFDKN